MNLERAKGLIVQFFLYSIVEFLRLLKLKTASNNEAVKETMLF